jgi:hypothetical protein
MNRAKLHRALDAVMNRAAAKDEDLTPYERKLALAQPGAHVILEAGNGGHGGNSGQEFMRLSSDTGAKVVQKHGSNIWVDLDTPHRLGKRWRVPVAAIKV